MISARRAHELIDIYTDMRKQACAEASGPVREFFSDQEKAVRGLTVEKLAEARHLDPAVLQHLVTP